MYIDGVTGRDAVEHMLAEFRLTPAEARMTRLLAAGNTVVEIADATCTRPATVRWHLKRVFAKTGVRTQSQLVALVHSRFPAQ